MAHAIAVESGMAHVALVGGRVAVLRAATVDDAAGVRALHIACSPTTLRDRYLGAPPRLTAATMAALLEPPTGCALVACAGRADGEVLGVAQMVGGPPVAELAILVRDDHQGRGLGTILGRRAVETAIRMGCTDMVAYALSGNARLPRLLRRLDLRTQSRYEGSMVTVRAPLGAPARPELTIVH